MSSPHRHYARRLVLHLLDAHKALRPHPDDAAKLIATKKDGEIMSLDLTPFEAQPQSAGAARHFHGVNDMQGLIKAYRQARRTLRFEDDLPEAGTHVHAYAAEFIQRLFSEAERNFSAAQAQLIAAWVETLDVYVAVKAVEALLNSKADLALLEVARKKGWQVHFDHLAIRCGSAQHDAAQRVVELLRNEHGYVAPQVEGEAFYQFAEGWSAYLLYKMLDSGRALRLFIDQSDQGHPTQIIQHWNHVYGYTAHHMGLRATHSVNGVTLAVPLQEMTQALAEAGFASLTPTGLYTQGLLLQVFVKPERNAQVPDAIKRRMSKIDANLGATIENAKLLELVSRREVPADFAREYYQLYGLRYDATNPAHSVPAYPYFLPAQAAHVIKTSIEPQP